jgi:hypothetical protein
VRLWGILVPFIGIKGIDVLLLKFCNAYLIGRKEVFYDQKKGSY